VGGKSSTSTSSVSIPPDVLAQYNSVNAAAEQTATKPFQTYNGQFVAPVNSEQQQGIATTNASAAPVNADPLTGQQINSYLSPYLGDVLSSTEALQNQENQQAQAGQVGAAISSGAFGGDRTGLAAANLQQQEDLANSNVISGIANQGYNTALATAQQQQGVNLSAAQANRAALASAGAQEIGAGTLEQQTSQAQDTALYNQFLQEQSYPFQVDQFLANIAEGTGALSGSTTTTTQPGGFFSDKRLKHDIKKIGELFDGQEIYSYKMHGDPRTHIGLIAQKVEKKHPEAVGLARGYKIVDYGKATEEAANRSHFADGGLARVAYAYGGGSDIQDILAEQRAMYGSSPGSGGAAYGLAAGSVPRGGSNRVPSATSSGAQLHPAQGPTQKPTSGMQNVSNLSDFANKMAKDYQGGKGLATNLQQDYYQHEANAGMSGTNAQIANDPQVQALEQGTGLAAGDATTATIADDMTVDPDIAMANRGGRFAVGGGVASGAMRMGPSPFARGPMPMPAAAPPTGATPPASTSPAVPVAPGTPAASPGGLVGLANGTGAAPTGQPQMGGLVGLSNGSGAAGVQRPMGGLVGAAGGIDRFDRRGYASGGGPYSDDVGAGSTMLGIPTASGRSEFDYGGLASAPSPPAQSTDQTGGLDKYDPAMQGLMASTQGKVKFDDGGVVSDAPQVDVPQSLNIPNDQSGGGGGGGSRLAVASPPSGGQSSGQQDMQDVMAIAEIAAMFAKRGGRIKKDDGGSASADPDALPDIEVDSSTPPPVQYTGGLNPVDRPSSMPVQTPDAVDTGAPAPKEDKPSTWGKIMEGLHAAGLDKATNVVPLLTGLAAMGTAPTKHLGVALAAGLGAGAQSYLPAQQQAADIQGKQIQNQMGQVGLKAYQDAMSSVGSSPAPSASSRPTAGPPTTQPPDDVTGLAAYYQAKYAVNPAMTDQEMANITRAQIAGGFSKNPGLAQAAMVPYQNRLKAQEFQNQRAAQLERDQAYQTYQQAMASGDTATAQRAAATVNAIHPWTGDKYENEAGSLRNSRTLQPPIGSVAQTLTPEQASQRQIELAKPVTYGAGLPMPLRTALGPSAAPAGPPTAQAPTTSTSNGTGMPPRDRRAISRPDGSSVAPKPSANAATSAQTDHLPGIDINAIPKLPGPPPVVDQVSKKNAEDIKAANLKISNDALDSYNEQVKAAARNTALYSQLNSKLAGADPKEFGPTSSYYKAYQGLVTALHGGDSPDGLVNQAEVDKYLTMLGVGGSKQLMGPENQLRQQELLTLMEHANPHMDQPLAAVRALVAYGKANNDFDLKAGNTAIDAITVGANPRKVSGIIDARRSDYIAQSLASTPVRTGTFNGKKVTQYADGSIR
jgi:hypothetical protein